MPGPGPTETPPPQAVTEGAGQPRIPKAPLSLGGADVFNPKGGLNDQNEPYPGGKEASQPGGSPLKPDFPQFPAKPTSEDFDHDTDPRKGFNLPVQGQPAGSSSTGFANEGGMALHEGPDRWPVATRGPSNDYEPLARWLDRLTGEKQDLSPEFYAKLKEAYARLEATGRVAKEDVDTITAGGREFAKDATGVEDTADLDEETAAKFARATGAYMEWILRKIR